MLSDFCTRRARSWLSPIPASSARSPAAARSSAACRSQLPLARARLMDPPAQHRRIEPQLLRHLGSRGPRLGGQPYGLTLELSIEPSSLHLTPPISSSHLSKVSGIPGEAQVALPMPLKSSGGLVKSLPFLAAPVTALGR